MFTQPVTGRPHRNPGLFSDHYYLDHTLPGRGDWASLVAQAGPVMAGIRALFESYSPSNNEAQAEENLIKPVLRLLGHEGTFEVQPTLKTPDGTKRPD